jgi:hypothetical protein
MGVYPAERFLGNEFRDKKKGQEKLSKTHKISEAPVEDGIIQPGKLLHKPILIG